MQQPRQYKAILSAMYQINIHHLNEMKLNVTVKYNEITE